MEKSKTNSSDKKWSLKGKTALVTGGSKGIGLAVVEELARLGAAVHTCARNPDRLEKRLNEWRSYGFQVTGSVCDVSSEIQRVELMKKVSSLFHGKLDILINNVGAGYVKPTMEFSAEELSTSFAVNFESAFSMCRLAYPLLKASGSGSIVSISSVAGVVSINASSVYGAAKGALNQLTKDLACEWAKDNIRINSVAPWLIKTSLSEQASKRKKSFHSHRITNSSRTPWRSDGGFPFSCIPVFTCVFLHNGPNYMR